MQQFCALNRLENHLIAKISLLHAHYSISQKHFFSTNQKILQQKLNNWNLLESGIKIINYFISERQQKLIVNHTK